jgi:hypothetical protein
VDSLRSLIKVLRPSEKKLLRHYYSRITNSEDKLRLKLFNLIERGKVSDKESALANLKHSGGASFSHLKSRLKNDILNILLLQETNKRFAQLNRAAELECRKKVAQSHILLLRGAQLEGLNILRKALALAERFELFGEKLQMNHLLREYSASSSPAVELERLNSEINKDLKRYEVLLYVEEQSVLLASPEMGKLLRAKSNEKKYIQLIDDLGKLYKKHKVARIGFWYFMAATEYYTTQGNYEKVLELGLSFLMLVEKSPAIRSKNNRAGVNQTVGFAQMELRNFDQSIKYLGVAEKLFAAAGFNRLQCLQFLAVSELALGRYKDSLQTIEKAFSHHRIAVREQLLPRWLFIKSCLEFLQGDENNSFKTLNQNGYLMKQQDEWNIQYRLLEMLQLIEMGDEEWLDFKLDATRKFLTRHKNLDTARVRAAIDLISNLLRKELDFSGISEKNHKLLKLCLEESNGYEWNPTGAEIVRFDRWVQNKRLSQEAE